MSNTLIINRVHRLSAEDEGGIGIARLCNNHIESFRSRKARFSAGLRFARRQAVIVSNPATRLWILRYAFGNPGSLSLKGDEIAIDYDGLQQLGITSTAVSLNVTRASWWQICVHFWYHHDLNVQISMRLGLIGFVLGVIGFFTSIIPFIV